MKKAVRTLLTLLEENSAEAAERKAKDIKQTEKSPKMVLLSCPQTLRLVSVDKSEVYTVESYGASVAGAAGTLDYALRRLNLPLLCILGHEDCSAVCQAKRPSDATDAEQVIYDDIAAALEGAPAKGNKRLLHYIDAQTVAALNRYNDLVKSEKLVICGLYADERGNVRLTNYNGLKGAGTLAYSLPEFDETFFVR